MKLKSIEKHLKPYSIFQKRKTTIAHAFASALAPFDQYDPEGIKTAMRNLGQNNMAQLACVYCGHPAQTWDHLVGLVRSSELRRDGFGHQIGNLVPCCRDCNSAKGGKSYREYIASLGVSDAEQQTLIGKLERHLSSAIRVDAIVHDQETRSVLEQLTAIKSQILELMKEADGLASKIHQRRILEPVHNANSLDSTNSMK